MLKLPSKQELANKFADYPLINSILCLLLYERLFRLAFVSALLFFPALTLFLLKIWTVSPAEFRPVVKISGLDLLQARSLKKTALKEAAKGKFDDALHSWRVAVVNNPADRDLIHGTLNHLLNGPVDAKYLPVVTSFSGWLLRLGQTNTADLEITMGLFNKYRLDDFVVHTLDALPEKLNPSLEEIYLKALFHRNQITRFEERWERLKREQISMGTDLEVYHAAYLAGWGPHETVSEGRERLRAARDNPDERLLAHRLQLKVSEQLVQADSYRESLNSLVDWRQDRLLDHTTYWLLLDSVGRRREALELVNEYVTPPSTGEETVHLAKAYFELGLKDESREVLKRYAPEFSDSEAVWITYSNLLIELKRWDDLSLVAMHLRHENNPLRDVMLGYSFFIQGLADVRRDRPDLAREAFVRIMDSRLRNRVWELAAAEQVEKLGFPDIAQTILREHEEETRENPAYWLLMAKTAYEMKDPEVIVAAMASAYKLRPDDFFIVHNYAAALLSNRQRPEEALRLTSRVLERAPMLVSSRINHVLALLLNGKNEEARALLAALRPETLHGAELASYYFALFELNLNEKQYAQALEVGKQIDDSYLFPVEKQFIQASRQRIDSELQQSLN